MKSSTYQVTMLILFLLVTSATLLISSTVQNTKDVERKTLSGQASVSHFQSTCNEKTTYSVGNKTCHCTQHDTVCFRER